MERIARYSTMFWRPRASDLGNNAMKQVADPKSSSIPCSLRDFHPQKSVLATQCVGVEYRYTLQEFRLRAPSPRHDVCRLDRDRKGARKETQPCLAHIQRPPDAQSLSRSLYCGYHEFMVSCSSSCAMLVSDTYLRTSPVVCLSRDYP